MKTILTIIFTILTLSGFTQSQFYTVADGETAIFRIAENKDTLILNDSGGDLVYENYKDGVYGAGRVFKIPTTAPDDTIATVLATMTNAKDAMLFERGSERRGIGIIVENDSLYFGSYGNGDKPILNGSEIITNWEERGGVAAVSDWSKALNTPWTNTTWQQHRLILPNTELSVSGNYIQLTVKAHPTSDSDIGGMSIGVRSTGDDFSTTPTRVTFDGGSSTTTVLAGIDKQSDWVLYTSDTTSDQMVHIYLATNQEDYMYFSGGGESYRSISSTDNTLTSSVDYGASGIAIRIISNYEVKTVTNIWGTPSPYSTATNPDARWTSVVIDDDMFWPVTDIDDLDADLEYYVRNDAGATTDSVFVYSETDPATRTTELSTTTTGINCSLTATPGVAYKNPTVKNINFKQYAYTGVQFRGLETDTVSTYGVVDNCDFYLTRIYSAFMRYSRHNVVKNSTFDYCGNGPYAARGGDTCSIINNTITNTIRHSIDEGFTDGHAIGVYSSHDVIVEGNTAIAETFGGGALGADLMDGIVRYNHFTAKYYGAIFPNDTGAGDTLLVHHNVLIGEEAGHPFIIQNTTSLGGVIQLYNNTMYSTYDNVVGDTYMMKTFYNSNDLTWKNNIIYNNGDVYSIISHIDTELATMDYNLWYNNSASYFIVGNLAGARDYYPTLLSWQGSGNGTNSVEGDALFTNAAIGDFTLQAGSPAIGIGEDLGFTRDILGNPIVGTPDIGAYEKQ